MRESFWTKEWFLGLIIGLIMAVMALLGQFQRLDHSVYDLATRLSPATPTSRIAIVGIDAKSIEALGPWPWPRSRLGEIINTLQNGSPSVVATTLPLSEPQIDPGLAAIRELQQQYGTSSLSGGDKLISSVRRDILLSARTLGQRAPAELRHLDQRLRQQGPLLSLSRDIDKLRHSMDLLEQRLNTDKIFSAAIEKAGDVDLAMTYEPGITQGNPNIKLMPSITRNALTGLAAQKNAVTPTTAYSIQQPLAILASHSNGIGFFAPRADEDGKVRRIPMVIRFYQYDLPNLGLLIALQSLNLSPSEITYRPGTGLIAGSLTIRTGRDLQLRPHFQPERNHGDHTFGTYSFADVLNGNISPDTFRDKIVLIGLTAPSIASMQTTSAGTPASPVEILADTVSSILNQNAFYIPDWAIWGKLAAWGLILVYLIGIIPLLNNRYSAVASLLLLSAVSIAMFYPLLNGNAWISLTNPILLLIVGHMAITLKRQLPNSRLLLSAGADGIENTRMLGLAFQEQGQLDLALDRFKQLPPNNTTYELLYNLALDYERRRRFNKAHEIYAQILKHSRNYRDAKERLKRTESLTELKPPQGVSQSDINSAHTMILGQEGIQKPMLGRYEIDREIGRGAMSIVYEGKDPKIGRIVAVKTLPLTSEFDAEELDKVKRRFYREAETAGRLSHPNIVTIYDVGEEHDLAYIAMEYLKGRNLTHFLNRRQLLPPATVLEIIAKCAYALDYAHRQQVIHRDIKPANIVYDIDADTVKLTDFGIARITDASRTKTGTVMGTPSYMSPEQLAGQRLDGRSDLFSLGITCFQLLTGEVPFQADTMASLMYKITNEAHPALNSLRDDLAPCVSPIVNKVLQKNPDKRFQTGLEMAEHLMECIHDIKEMQS